MAGRILRGLEAMLSDWMGPVKLRVDEDQISELAEDRAKLWAQVEAASFLSDAEKRDMLGFKEDPHPTLSPERERAQ
jgi:phage portal protein BeeE